MRRAFRSSLILLMLVLQVALAGVRGQALVVDACAEVRESAAARSAMALSDEFEDWSRGSHRHDDLPLHLHVPEDGTVRARSHAPLDAPAQPFPPTAFALVSTHDGLSLRSACGARSLCSAPRRADRVGGSIESLKTVRILV